MDYKAVYGQMHARNPKAFSGYSIKDHVQQIAELVRTYSPMRLLDYGSGKGYQYLQRRVQYHWGGMLPHCYDPGVPQLREKPEGKFGGIICTDVLEHIEETDVPGLLEDIFGYLEEGGFAYFCVAIRPAKRKRLPDGRDVHVTIKPREWWDRQLDAVKPLDAHVVVNYDEG